MEKSASGGSASRGGFASRGSAYRGSASGEVLHRGGSTYREGSA